MAPDVRLANRDDAAAIGQLLYAFNREFDEPAPPPDALAERIRQLLDGGECYLAELYVTPARRGQGLGRALMEAALREARNRGAETIDIGVDEPDLAARRLYESLGFTNRSGGDGPLMYVYEREL
jgi:ribosomal protein S18 acetylase RimI-like enzyme